MKLLWKSLLEIKHNKFSTLLILLELVFTMVCYSLCFSFAGSYLSSAVFFTKHYNGNSFQVTFAKMDDSELSGILNDERIAEYFTARYSYANDGNGTVYFGNYSKNTFTDLALDYSGKMVDTAADYGEAVPVMVSKSLAEQYKIGETYTIKDVQIYVCGALKNDNLYYMTSLMTTNHFIAAYDPNGKLSAMDKSSANCAFVRVKDGITRLSDLREEIEAHDGISGTTSFKWQERMSDEFDTVSGMLMIGFVILVLSVLGFLTNNYLTFKKNEKSYARLICIGAKKSDIMLLYAIRMLVLIGVTAAGVKLAAKPLGKFIKADSITDVSLLMAVATVVVVTAVSVGYIGLKIRKANLTKLLKD
ncbi:MAG: hypothetical protein QM689_07205 [Oscillospiraceae bacterium]